MTDRRLTHKNQVSSEALELYDTSSDLFRRPDQSSPEPFIVLDQILDACRCPHALTLFTRLTSLLDGISKFGESIGVGTIDYLV